MKTIDEFLDELFTLAKGEHPELENSSACLNEKDMRALLEKVYTRTIENLVAEDDEDDGIDDN